MDETHRKTEDSETPEFVEFAQMLAKALGQVEVINISAPVVGQEKEEKLKLFLSEQYFNKEEFIQKMEQICQIFKNKGAGIALERELVLMMKEVEESI